MGIVWRAASPAGPQASGVAACPGYFGSQSCTGGSLVFPVLCYLSVVSAEVFWCFRHVLPPPASALNSHHQPKTRVTQLAPSLAYLPLYGRALQGLLQKQGSEALQAVSPWGCGELVGGLWTSGVFMLVVLHGRSRRASNRPHQWLFTAVFVSSTQQKQQSEVLQIPQVCPAMKAATQS